MAFVKHLHLIFVALSILSFIVRGIWMLKESPILKAKLVKILPHIIDTILLVSGLSLAIVLSVNPSQQPWLMAKIVVLIIYIVLGIIALKPTRPKKIRAAAFVLGIIAYIFIASAAITKSPTGFFAFM